MAWFDHELGFQWDYPLKHISNRIQNPDRLQFSINLLWKIVWDLYFLSNNYLVPNGQLSRV